MRQIALFVLLAATAFAQTPVVVEGGVLNAASAARGQAVSPGSIVAIYGSDLAAGLAQADSVPLATTLTDVSVRFNDIPAPLLFVADQQINAQLPFNVLPDPSQPGTVSVVVRRGNVTSEARTVQVAPAGPGIFTFDFGPGRAVAINLDGTLAAAPGTIPPFTSHPAPRGSTIIVLCTGLGQVNPPGVSGADSRDQLRRTVNTPIVRIGGVEARVEFSGLSPDFPGVYQLNLTIDPATPAGDQVPIQIEMSGVTSRSDVTLAVN